MLWLGGLGVLAVAVVLENIHRSRRQQDNHQQRNQRLDHHQNFCPTRQHRHVGGRECSAGVESQEEATNREEGKAAYKAPLPSRATITGQRGSTFFGEFKDTEDHAWYSKRATSDSPMITVSPSVNVASVMRSDFGSFTNVPLRESWSTIFTSPSFTPIQR